jgi:hypothetical protein
LQAGVGPWTPWPRRFGKRENDACIEEPSNCKRLSLSAPWQLQTSTGLERAGCRCGVSVDSDQLQREQEKENSNGGVNGSGVQFNSFKRWGDYSSMSVDPTDDCTLWYINEYYTFTGSLDWATRIGSFKFNSCKWRIALIQAIVIA